MTLKQYTILWKLMIAKIIFWDHESLGKHAQLLRKNNDVCLQTNTYFFSILLWRNIIYRYIELHTSLTCLDIFLSILIDEIDVTK